ncbi:DUF4244 domain-containing protein [Aeromicrobium sp. CF4.19]|uniref:DUF4244 domain-containing protein n=1 Tax=Aeromicrobium sp. CF4.19 TaxID=3373082 RepID=UPI003EE7CFC8
MSKSHPHPPRAALRAAARRGEEGMTTAEYTVGTLGACTLAGVLAHLGADDWFLDIVRDIILRALDPTAFLDLLGSPRPYFRYTP